jgi:hypothetical protein
MLCVIIHLTSLSAFPPAVSPFSIIREMPQNCNNYVQAFRKAWGTSFNCSTGPPVTAVKGNCAGQLRHFSYGDRHVFSKNVRCPADNGCKPGSSRRKGKYCGTTFSAAIVI